eukprot:TRINITY_DN4428_c0_g3_i3.p1 TRINITY_DN4428_c0_g3~~TRINITY_DN4428_c0_g3_i3.p1  ORF type:complete len:800 (-),score=151.44 TRINITY_DN4428_c0_g3_i3:101-2500(-)
MYWTIFNSSRRPYLKTVPELLEHLISEYPDLHISKTNIIMIGDIGSAVERGFFTADQLADIRFVCPSCDQIQDRQHLRVDRGARQLEVQELETEEDVAFYQKKLAFIEETGLAPHEYILLTTLASVRDIVQHIPDDEEVPPVLVRNLNNGSNRNGVIARQGLKLCEEEGHVLRVQLPGSGVVEDWKLCDPRRKYRKDRVVFTWSCAVCAMASIKTSTAARHIARHVEGRAYPLAISQAARLKHSLMSLMSVDRMKDYARKAISRDGTIYTCEVRGCTQTNEDAMQQAHRNNDGAAVDERGGPSGGRIDNWRSILHILKSGGLQAARNRFCQACSTHHVQYTTFSLEDRRSLLPAPSPADATSYPYTGFASENPVDLTCLPIASTESNTGLINGGNTCYMNAILQALMSLPSFTLTLRRTVPLLQQSEGTRNNFPLLSGEGSANFGSDSMCVRLLELVVENERPDRTTLLDAKEVKKVAGHYKALYSNGLQQDAHEFLIDTMLLLELDIKLLCVPPSQQRPLARAGPPKRNAASGRGSDDSGAAADERDAVFCVLDARERAWYEDELDEREQDIELVEKEFSPTATLTYTVNCDHTCDDCGDVSSVIESYSVLSLQVNDENAESPLMNTNLARLVEASFSAEHIDRRCPESTCAGERATVTRALRELPRVLVLHLMRFSVDARSGMPQKNEDAVVLPTELDVTRCCAPALLPDHDNPASVLEDDDVQALQTTYHIKAVVTHVGHSAAAGHYRTDVLADDIWERYDDSVVTNISEDDALRGKAEEWGYILFYENTAVYPTQ